MTSAAGDAGQTADRAARRRWRLPLPPVRSEGPGRWLDLASLAATAGLLALLAHDLIVLLPHLDPAKIAVDYHLYMDATARFFGGGGYYLPDQLHGPYDVVPGHILYPPLFTLVVAPFLVLPALAWWVLPVAAVAFVTWRLRPRITAWPGIALCLWFPGTTVMLVAGNPTMLIVAALALAARWSWPGVLVLLKPSLLPFALLGIRSRRWWVALGVLALLGLPFGAMWLDYARVLLDARQPLGPFYNLGQVPTMLLPVIAWAGRRR